MPKRRINQVTTRAGDQGETHLATARKVAKTDPIVRAMGSVDELNSAVGVLRLHAPAQQDDLQQVQQDLFDLGAVLAMEGQYDAPEFDHLEQLITTLNAELPPLTEFVLPGGSAPSAHSHMCRAICRRAEGDVWAVVAELTEHQAQVTCAAQYLNRASDLFFVLARSFQNAPEVQWQGPNQA